jgi:hypothetical protein
MRVSAPLQVWGPPFGRSPHRARIKGRVLRLAVVCLLWLGPPLAGNAVPTQTLSAGHVPAVVAHSAPIGSLPRAQRLHLAIGLPLRNQGELDALLRQLYDPSSANYHRYLTPEEFTARFGPTAKDYQALIDFAKSNDLRVTFTHPNRIVLDVEATVTDIQKAFHVTLRTYRHPVEAREFYAPDVEPCVELSPAILHISGLDNCSLPHPSVKLRPAGAPGSVAPSSGSGPGGSYRGSDFRKAYVPGTTLSGAEQSVGLLQFDGFYARDITNYVNQAGYSNVPPLIVVPVDGGVSPPYTNANEVSLDIEMVVSMAPGLSRVYVYEAPRSTTYWVDLLSRMANDNLAKQLSCSWVGGFPDATAEQIFKQMGAQGQSFFTASGDYDAYTGAIPFPADSPNITVVGGTTLTTSMGASYSSEEVWNWGLRPDGTYWGSSGGISTSYPIPSYQQGISMVANQGSTTMRNIPDVALTADNVYVAYDDGSWGAFGGTSCAAPLWAGFAALVNQQAAADGLPPVGFLNPALYSIGKGANYTAAFYDITTGNNFSSNSPSRFPAMTGYDLCTGWGTPCGVNLIRLLAREPQAGFAPWITRQPQSQIVNAEDSATFNVDAHGTAPLNYQWLFNGQPIHAATNDAYSVAQVQSVHVGTYSVVVSNAYGSVLSAPAILGINTSTAFGIVGAPFSYQVVADNDPTWYRAWGLPAGLVCDGVTGLISGAPDLTGTFSVYVEAKNVFGHTRSTTILITIADGSITSATGAQGILWMPFAYQITADNDPVWFSAWQLPQGLVCDGLSGLISGIPTQTGTYLAYVEVKNARGFTAWTNVLMTIRDPAITSATNVAGILGKPLVYLITADNSPSWFSASDLPPGLYCDHPSGLVYGTPSLTGTFSSYVEARNFFGTAWAYITFNIGDGTVPQPKLSIVRNGDSVRLTWPVTSEGFVLEETPVQSVAWTNSTATVVVEGDMNTAVIAAPGKAKFYRLRK